MPVTLVDRLPLPNLKVYTAGSMVLLSIAVYHAIGVTSDPAWRQNATLQRQEAAMAAGEGAVADLASPDAVAAALAARNITEQILDTMAYMMQEPLCMWTLINIAYCALAIIGFAIVRCVFGSLRVSEAQRVKDKFWNYVFYKFIFVFGVINVQYMDEVLLWCCWFTLVGFLHLLAQLCKDRFEYLSSSPVSARWAHLKLATLLALVLAGAGALLALAVAIGLPQGKVTFAFMAAECLLVVVVSLHVCARYLLQLKRVDPAGPLAYYTHLLFDSVCLLVETLVVGGEVVVGRAAVSLPALVLLLQLRHLLHSLHHRLRNHRLYTQLANHMSQNYPMASKEEVEKNQDNCAICWEPMKEARKLPCSHLFHNSCLCQWVQQDASCPTCRRGLAPARGEAGPGAGVGPGLGALAGPDEDPAADDDAVALPLPLPLQLPLPRPRNAHNNHLFHFDGSRYVSWLPSFSVEVTRVRPPPPHRHQIDAMARQVQTMFPQYSLSVLSRDLAETRSADLTIDNILEGRLPPPPATPPATPPPLATPQAAPSASAPALFTDGGPSSLAHSSHDAPNDEASDDAQDEPETGTFSSDASQRALALRRRKEALLRGARRRYLARHNLPTTSTSTPHTNENS